MKRIPILLSLLFTSLSPAYAANFVFQHGPLSLTFDSDTAALLQINCRGQEIAHGDRNTPTVTFGIGPADKVVWAENMGMTPKLIHQAQTAPDTLELTVSVGSYELLERYRLYPNQARLDRSVQLTNRGSEVVKLRGLAFRMPGIVAPAGGFYRFPKEWPPHSHSFAAMQSGRKAWGPGSIAPALAQLSPRQSILWASYTIDAPSVEVTEGAGQFEVRQGVESVGYLRPGAPQEMGFVSLEVVDGDYWAALPHLWNWMDSVGLKVPADRPEWVRQAVLYSFHPGGTIGSNFHDLGGFNAATERLIPTLPRLGVNAIWVMPVEYREPYWPFDYYRFMDGIGTGADYKALVARAHGLGLHVLQDLVPHGGSPQAVHNMAHPEFMLHREDGTTFDYWLNDFAWPTWQQYIAGVADHYVREYNVDGYRVDAAGGSREPNWNPAIPYARASMAKQWGGLGMLHAIRSAVRKAKPQTGAILAELESARHLAECDAEYDFGFCYTLCQQWRHEGAGDFVAGLQEYFEEQKYSEPRGAVRLRHIESHDSLRSQGWYGVRGMRAMYALSAWIDGIPLIYQGMETGNSAEIAQINAIRSARPELTRGEAFYRIVKCDTPGVFTCLRKLGNRSSVVVINFNREPVQALIAWPGGHTSLHLRPLEYTVLPRPKEAQPETSRPARMVSPAAASTMLTDPLPLEGAKEWFVDTLEGRLWDRLPEPAGAETDKTASNTYSGSIYWRPQGGGVLWQGETLPLYPGGPQIGFKRADGSWRVLRFQSPIPEKLRLVNNLNRKWGLWLLGAQGGTAQVMDRLQLPPAPDVTAPLTIGGVKLRCVGSEYIISNTHFTVYLERQGGMIRQVRSGQTVVAENQDLYGDQPYFAHPSSPQMQAMNDVESGIRVWEAADGLHLHFEGQLRGEARFDLMRPPLWYRNDYVFSEGPRFAQDWAFRTDKSFHDQKAFLTYFVGRVAADRFRFTHGGQVVAEDAIAEGESTRRGEARTKPIPDTLTFFQHGQPQLSLTNIQTPTGLPINIFMQGSKLFIPLLEGSGSSMDETRWYGFHADWNFSR